ncbi:MAG: hypothetical protein ABEJ83_02380, partial [Candidatus Nanohaloarchaea archaeon]
MPEVEFSELPGDLRVRLTEEGAEKLWHRVDEFGGVKSLSDSFGFSPSKMYNWRNRELALPVKFVRRIMGENGTSEITVLKGQGRSGEIESPVFPLRVSDELLTRVDASVKLNSERTPFYLVREKSLADRFVELLERLGRVDHKIYSRDSRYEVRYPKFLHRVFQQLEYNDDLAALVDERGVVQEDVVVVGERKLPVEGFEGELYSREKRFELALARGDS